MKGMDQVIRNLQALPKGLRGEVNRKAVMAGAEILRNEIAARSPVGPVVAGRKKHSPIKSNVIIYERKKRDAFTQGEADASISMLVGPSKKAYHAYWIEHGWNATGRLRRQRKATKTTHSQRGTTGGRFVTPNAFIARAFASKAMAAKNAMIEVYRSAIERFKNG